MIPIAQQSAQQASADILWMLGLVVFLAFVVAAVAWVIRKRTVGAEDPAAPGLTLSDLRQMHREGRMTDEEFEAAKRLVVAQGLSMMGPTDGSATPIDEVSDASAPASGDAGENPPADSDKNGDDDPLPPGA